MCIETSSREKIDHVVHFFAPNHTIDSIINLYNNHSLTKQEIIELRNQFNLLNNNIVPRPGIACKIPLKNSTKTI